MPFVMVMVAALGAMLGAGCEKPEIDIPQVTQPETPVQQTDTPGSFLVGEWAVNASMSENVSRDYKDTLVFTHSGIIEKHSGLAGARYYILNDSTIRFEDADWSCNKTFKYYPPNGIMFYNFFDNTAYNWIINVYYERGLE